MNIRLLKKIVIILILIIVYLISTVPIGLFLYSLKSNNGIDIFNKTGFHSYIHCLNEEAQKIGK